MVAHTPVCASHRNFLFVINLHGSGALVSWVNDSCILFVSYFQVPAALTSFASQCITCRAASHHLWGHLTHQHTQRMTRTKIAMAEAEGMQTMITVAETDTSQLSML